MNPRMEMIMTIVSGDSLLNPAMSIAYTIGEQVG